MTEMHADHREQPLSTQQWQALLHTDARRAARRYLHQVRLATTATSPLRMSIARFQYGAQRHPHRYLDDAIRLVPHLLTTPLETPFWDQLVVRAGDQTNPYLRFISPAALLHHLALDAKILAAQSQTWNISLVYYLQHVAEFPTAPTLRDFGTYYLHPLTEPHGRAAVPQHQQLQHELRYLVAQLAIALEEHASTTQWHVVRPSDFCSPLLPYPNEALWQQLLTEDPAAARAQLYTLERIRAQVGIHLPFPLGESIAAYTALTQFAMHER